MLPTYTAIFLNMDREIVKDKIIRNALRDGADKATISEVLPSKQIIAKPFFQYENIENIGKADFRSIRNDLEYAGWELNSDGIYEKDEKELKIDMVVPVFTATDRKNIDTQRLVEHLTNTYSEIGIKLVSSYYEGETFAAILASKNYDAILYGHNLGNNLDTYSFWHSSQGGKDGFNLSNYKNVAVDNLLEILRKSPDPEKRKEIILDLNAKITEDNPAIFLYTEKHIFAFDNKIKNRKILSHYAFTSDRFYDINQWQFSN
jgi:ABC-type transport system substrate-binding protein